VSDWRPQIGGASTAVQNLKNMQAQERLTDAQTAKTGVETAVAQGGVGSKAFGTKLFNPVLDKFIDLDQRLMEKMIDAGRSTALPSPRLPVGKTVRPLPGAPPLKRFLDRRFSK